jgi:hypothetical protein
MSKRVGFSRLSFTSWRRRIGMTGLSKYEERQFIAGVEGELRNPVLETSKVSEFMWVDRANVERLKENRKLGDQLIYDSVLEALDFLETRRTPR